VGLLKTVARATVGRLFDWVRGNRTAVFVLAIALVAVPTFAALFPGYIHRTHRVWRIVVMLAWLGVAIVATIASQSRESAVRSMTRASHRMLLRPYLESLLGSNSEIPDGYDTTIYIANDAGLLLPWYPDQVTDPADPTVFRIGCGATGYSVSEDAPIAVVGDAVSSGEYGLTPGQQQFFSAAAVVVAVPIHQLADQIVGALTVISDTNDEFFVSDGARIQETGVRVLLALADRIGEALEGMEF
jgi:hypothetical protein